MIRTRDTFAQALAALRHSARAGEFVPGRPIVIQDEARRLRLSTTPVREALSWMCGEGLLERAPLGGFVAPRLDASTLANRYRFRLLCLDDAFARGGEWIPDAARTEPLGVADLFRHLVASVGDPVLSAAFDRVQCHLEALAPVEAVVLQDLEAETHALLTGPDLGPPGRGLDVYHRRRMDAAPRLALAALQSMGRPLA